MFKDEQTTRAGTGYDAVPENEDETFDINEKLLHRREVVVWRRQRWLLVVNIILLLSTIITILAAVYDPFSTLSQKQKSCGRLLGQWLPDAEDGVEYEIQRFKGTFGLKNQYTGFGPEVDAAWNNITEAPTGGAIGITEQQWKAVNSHPQFPVLLEHDVGTGNHLASLDVFHQLHCVDLLRKSLHREYYDKHEGSFAGAPEHIVQGHLEHCVETLRQTIMCHGDISLLTYNWVKGREMPHPNFNTVHMCKKWDTLVRYNMARDVTAEWSGGTRVKDIEPPTKPSDVVGLSVAP